MSSCAIIADTHLNHNNVEAWISSTKPDKVVFLGDYFDNWDDSPKENAEASAWLKESMRNPQRIHLLGNHDIHYMDPNVKTKRGAGASLYRGSGWSQEKHEVINNILSEDDWLKLRPCHMEQGWALSHAGLAQTPPKLKRGRATPNPWKGVKNAESVLKSAMIKVLDNKWDARLHATVWTKWARFQPVRHLNQIVGHSESSKPRCLHLIGNKKEKDSKCPVYLQYEEGYLPDGDWCGSISGDIQPYVASTNWCLDTGSKYFGIIEGGKFTVVENPNKPEYRPIPPDIIAAAEARRLEQLMTILAGKD